jgi:hypothetical protein
MIFAWRFAIFTPVIVFSAEHAPERVLTKHFFVKSECRQIQTRSLQIDVARGDALILLSLTRLNSSCSALNKTPDVRRLSVLWLFARPLRVAG